MKNDLLSRTMSCSVADIIRLSFESDTQCCKHLYLPDFQRPFVWTTTDIQKLLDDIDELRSIPGTHVWDETYRDDEYYLGAICLRPKDPEDQTKGWEVLDGQQRLTSIMLLAKVLYDRAQKIKNLNTGISEMVVKIDEQMGSEENWRNLILYSDPKTIAHIQKIYKELERNYLLLEADSLDDEAPSDHANFYEDTLLLLHDKIKYPPNDNQIDPPGLSEEVLSNVKKKEDYGFLFIQKRRIKNHDHTDRKSKDSTSGNGGTPTDPRGGQDARNLAQYCQKMHQRS